MTIYNATYQHPLRYKHTKTQVAARALLWLRAGWDDFVRSPANSIAIGLGFTALCLAAYCGNSPADVFNFILDATVIGKSVCGRDSLFHRSSTRAWLADVATVRRQGSSQQGA